MKQKKKKKKILISLLVKHHSKMGWIGTWFHQHTLITPPLTYPSGEVARCCCFESSSPAGIQIRCTPQKCSYKIGNSAVISLNMYSDLNPLGTQCSLIRYFSDFLLYPAHCDPKRTETTVYRRAACRGFRESL